MRTLSRHLPPAPPTPQISRTMLGLVLGVCGIIIAVAFSLEQVRPVAIPYIIIATIVFGVSVVLSKIGDKRLKAFMLQRKGESICTFRRAFNLRQVDPWIVRAVHEELCDWLSHDSSKQSHPIRASDRLLEDLQIDPEDVEDMGKTIAFRAVYDFSDTTTNPLFGKIVTVGDLVMFFTHQRSARSGLSLSNPERIGII